MRNNLDIPGWMSETDLRVLTQLAGLVPENGNILEVGSFLGRSTYALYHGKPASVQLEIVDTFIISEDYSADIENYTNLLGNKDLAAESISIASNTGSWLESFKHCVTPNVANQLTINVTTSKEYKLSKEFDMVFIDANHYSLNVIADIKKFAGPNTLLVGDDFGPLYVGIPIALAAVRKELKGTLIVPENSKIWIMIPTTGYWKEVFQKNILY